MARNSAPTRRHVSVGRTGWRGAPPERKQWTSNLAKCGDVARYRRGNQLFSTFFAFCTTALCAIHTRVYPANARWAASPQGLRLPDVVGQRPGLPKEEAPRRAIWIRGLRGYSLRSHRGEPRHEVPTSRTSKTVRKRAVSSKSHQAAPESAELAIHGSDFKAAHYHYQH